MLETENSNINSFNSSKVSFEEIKDLIAKVQAFKRDKGKALNEEMKDAYMASLCPKPEDIVKFLAIYEELYPEDKEGIDEIKEELEKEYRKKAKFMGVFLFMISESLKRIYKQAFKRYIRSLNKVDDVERQKRVHEKFAKERHQKQEESDKVRRRKLLQDELLRESEPQKGSMLRSRERSEISLTEKIRPLRDFDEISKTAKREKSLTSDLVEPEKQKKHKEMFDERPHVKRPLERMIDESGIKRPDEIEPERHKKPMLKNPEAVKRVKRPARPDAFYEGEAGPKRFFDRPGDSGDSNHDKRPPKPPIHGRPKPEKGEDFAPHIPRKPHPFMQDKTARGEGKHYEPDDKATERRVYGMGGKTGSTQRPNTAKYYKNEYDEAQARFLKKYLSPESDSKSAFEKPQVQPQAKPQQPEPQKPKKLDKGFVKPSGMKYRIDDAQLKETTPFELKFKTGKRKEHDKQSEQTYQGFQMHKN